MAQKLSFKQIGKKKKTIKKAAAILAAFALLVGVLFLSQLDNRSVSYSEEQPVGSVDSKAVSVVDSGHTQWQYRDESTPPPEDANGLSWLLPNYSAEGWKTGQGSFGAENGQRTDRVNDRYPANLPEQYATDGSALPVHYFRTEFTLDELLTGWQMKGSIQFDDAVMVFLNGEPVYSDNVPEGGYDEASGGYGAVEAVGKSLTREFTLTNVTALRKGRNVLAVELHQSGKNSTDLYFDFISLDYSPTNTALGSVEGNVILEPGATQSSRRVNWLTTEKMSYTVQFAPQDTQNHVGAYQTVVMERHRDDENGVYCYSAALNNLLPERTYQYRIMTTNGEAASDQYTFSTRNAQAPVSFLMVGDVQIGADSLNADLAGWSSTLDAALAIDPNPAFLYSAGDLVDSSNQEEALKQYFLFRSPAQLMRLPLITVQGNHDSSLYRLQFHRTTDNTEGNDSFMYGNTLFVRLNTNNKNSANQRQFLESAISNNPSQWVVVLMHYSMFSSGPHAQDEEIAELREEYAETFSRLNVDLVLSGHDHLYSRTYLMDGAESTGKDGGLKLTGETMYVTANSASGSKYYDSELTPYDYLAALYAEQQPYITQVEIMQNELRLTTYRSADREEIDSCVITK